MKEFVEKFDSRIIGLTVNRNIAGGGRLRCADPALSGKTAIAYTACTRRCSICKQPGRVQIMYPGGVDIEVLAAGSAASVNRAHSGPIAVKLFVPSARTRGRRLSRFCGCGIGALDFSIVGVLDELQQEAETNRVGVVRRVSTTRHLRPSIVRRGSPPVCRSGPERSGRERRSWPYEDTASMRRSIQSLGRKTLPSRVMPSMTIFGGSLGMARVDCGQD
jgi:hypothetical protein